MSLQPVDRVLRRQVTLRSDMTTLASVSVKVRKNGGAATTYTSATSPAVLQLADCAFAYAIEIPASTYADGDRIEFVWLYAGTAYATGVDVIGPAAVDGSKVDVAVSTRSTLTAAQVWAALTSGLSTVGSIGKLIADYLDAAVSSRSTYAGGDTSGTTTLLSRLTAIRAGYIDNLDVAVSSRASQASLDTVAGYVDNEVAAIKAKTDNLPASPAATGDIPSAATVADAVWDEALSGHATAGSAGAALSAAGGAADPLGNTVPGSYASGTAGYILGHVIPGQSASIEQPLAEDLELTVVQGDDYNATDSRGIDWTEPNAAWPTLTGATVKFGYQEIVNGQLTGAATELSMSVVTGTGSSKKVRLELTASQSAALGVGKRRYEYDVQATLTSGRKVTLARGLVTVLPSIVA